MNTSCSAVFTSRKSNNPSTLCCINEKCQIQVLQSRTPSTGIHTNEQRKGETWCASTRLENVFQKTEKSATRKYQMTRSRLEFLSHQIYKNEFLFNPTRFGFFLILSDNGLNYYLIKNPNLINIKSDFEFLINLNI